MSEKIIKEFAKLKNFDYDDAAKIMKIMDEYPKAHSYCHYKIGSLYTAEDYYRAYDACWYRDTDWEKDIVDYEMDYLPEYEKEGICNREQLSEYLKTVDWIIKVREGLWIEYTV